MHKERVGTVIHAAIRMQRRRLLRPVRLAHRQNHQQSASGWAALPPPLSQPVHLDLANSLHAVFARREKNVRFPMSGILLNGHLPRSRASSLPQERVTWVLFVCLNMSSLPRQRSQRHQVLDHSPEVYVKPHKSRSNYSLYTPRPPRRCRSSLHRRTRPYP